MKFEEAAISIWRQVLLEDATEVTLDTRIFPVRRTIKKNLREVDFSFEGQPFRAIEQNPTAASRWAKLAREGHRVMQFLSEGRYVANVVDGKVTVYRHAGR